MNKVILFILFSSISLWGFAQTCPQSSLNSYHELNQYVFKKCSSSKTEIIAQLKAQGFQCDFVSNESSGSTRCRGSMAPAYSQPINIFIPNTFESKKPFELAYHFYGWNNTSFDQFGKSHGEFGRYLAESSTNKILIVPESRGKNDDHKSLNSGAKVDAFFSGVDQILNKAGVPSNENTARNLSGHSGAYSHLTMWGRFLNDGSSKYLKSVRSMALFDSLYSYKSGMGYWAQHLATNPQGSFYIAYNQVQDAGKNQANKMLYDKLCENKSACARTTFIQDKSIDHVDFMNKYMSDYFKR